MAMQHLPHYIAYAALFSLGCKLVWIGIRENIADAMNEEDNGKGEYETIRSSRGV